MTSVLVVLTVYSNVLTMCQNTAKKWALCANVICHNRMANNEAPACAQACPTEAIKITIVDQDKPDREVHEFLPDTIDPGYTRPTTQYVSSKEVPQNAEAADHNSLRPQHAHLSLYFLYSYLPKLPSVLSEHSCLIQDPSLNLILALVTGLIGLGLGTFPLGQTTQGLAFLPRLTQIVAQSRYLVFGAYTPLIKVLVAAQYFFPDYSTLIQLGAGAAFATGLLGVFCSAMIYADTMREP